MVEVNPEIDTTKFVNIYEKDFTFYINKQPRELKAGEEKIMPIYVAQIGAKHLVDKILQEKHNVKDTLRDTDLRRSLFAQILPDMAEERNIKPLSEDDFRQKIKEELKRQSELISQLSGDKGLKEDKIAELEKQIQELKEKLAKRPGRPPKEESNLE